MANTDHKFSCGINPQDSISWYYYQQEDQIPTEITGSSGPQYELSSNLLTIYNVSTEMEGYYYCKIGNITKNASRLLVLGVCVCVCGCVCGCVTSEISKILILNIGNQYQWPLFAILLNRSISSPLKMSINVIIDNLFISTCGMLVYVIYDMLQVSQISLV